MTALIFFVLGVAMLVGLAGRRDIATALFALGFVGSVVWLAHHMTDPLAISL